MITDDDVHALFREHGSWPAALAATPSLVRTLVATDVGDDWAPVDWQVVQAIHRLQSEGYDVRVTVLTSDHVTITGYEPDD